MVTQKYMQRFARIRGVSGHYYQEAMLLEQMKKNSVIKYVNELSVGYILGLIELGQLA